MHRARSKLTIASLFIDGTQDLPPPAETKSDYPNIIDQGGGQENAVGKS